MSRDKITLRVTANDGKPVSLSEADEVLEKALRKMRGEQLDTVVLPDDKLEQHKTVADGIFQLVIAAMITEIVAEV